MDNRPFVRYVVTDGTLRHSYKHWQTAYAVARRLAVITANNVDVYRSVNHGWQFIGLATFERRDNEAIRVR